MIVRRWLAVCLALVVVELALVRGTAREERADFVYVNPAGIHTLDPARMSWTQDFRVALNLWEGLTRWHPETLEPMEGAASLPPRVSEDGRSYTFFLREDARWSNGDPVTAADFVRGWRRAMEPGTSADYAFLFTDHIAGAREYVRWRNEAVASLTPSDRAPSDGPHVSGAVAQLHEHAARLDARFGDVGVRAADDRTLAVELTRPCPYLLDLLGLPVFLPCHESIERLRERSDDLPITPQGLVVYDPQWTKPDYGRNGYAGLITNGAYRLAAWDFKRRVRFQVNSHHRDAARIHCKSVEMMEYDNVNASLLAYEAGQVDFLTDLSVPYDHELARLARSGQRLDFHPCVLLATHFLNFNCSSPEIGGRPNPFVDPRVRKAFTLAVDRETIVDNVRRRGDRAAHSFVPPGAIPGYDPPDGLRQDIAQARRLLSEAGYANGREVPTVELLFVPNDERVCQAMARMWEENLDVRVELRSQESKTFAEEKANHRFMMARGNWYADYNDPTTFLDCLISGNGNNDSGYASAAYDKLMSQANEASGSRRMELLRRAESVIVEQDCPILPILHYTELVAIKPYVRGLHANARLWFPFQYVTIDR